MTGHEQTVGAGMLLEREHLLPLAEEGFDLAEASFPTVNTLGCVKVRTNAYSCPVRAGTTVQAKLSAATVEVWHEGHCVAKHQRCYGRYQEVMDLEHYLDVLEHKPGALGCQDSAAVRHLLAAAQLERMPVAPLQLGLLARFDRPTEEEIYGTFLKHTPPGLEDEFRDLYRRLHGGPFAFPETEVSNEPDK